MLKAVVHNYSEDPNWTSFRSVVRTEGWRYPETSAAQSDRAWGAIFARLAEAGVASGEVDPADKRATQAVLSAIVLAFNQQRIEADQDAHSESVRGLGVLLRGMLVKPLPGQDRTDFQHNISAASKVRKQSVAH